MSKNLEEKISRLTDIMIETLNRQFARPSLDPAQIRELMLMGGNLQRIKERLKSGKKPKLVRKKEGRRDPVYMQFGDGVEEPIEEYYLIG
jgi:hypothetical protein